jgi:Calcineurin-like phosphoesterase
LTNKATREKLQVVLLGDLHGDVHVALQLLESQPKTVLQIGDFGFRKAWEAVAHLDTGRLMVVGGNHEDYHFCANHPCFLGDFGLVPGCEDTFFVRGSASVDHKNRIPALDVWPEEEINLYRMEEVVEAYCRLKPKVVIAHDLPQSVRETIFKHNRQGNTRDMMDAMFAEHVPERWYFGHYHKSGQQEVLGCQFRCLGIHETCEVELP